MEALACIGMVTGAVSAPLAAVSIPNSAVATSVASASLAQGTAAQQNSKGSSGQDPKDDPRLEKFTLIAHCNVKSSVRDQVHGTQVVLRNNKLYLDNPAKRRFPDGHPFSGFYLEYPSGQTPAPLGLVSTISKEPPELNWIYVDKNTLELKYGNRTQSLPHIFAPWDWTEHRDGLTLEGWEGFVALEDTSGIWVLCYDRDDDHLKHLREKRRVLECSLERRISQG